jgi:hypothetical protein
VKSLAFSFLLVLSSCGYKFAATDTVLPKNVHTIAIPAFNNLTTRYKLTDQMPEAISREFLTRTRYRVVPDVNSADAILRGAVVNYSFNPTIFDPATGRAAYAELHVAARFSSTGRTLTCAKPTKLVRTPLSTSRKAILR